jgi:hypothetical protein
MHNVTFLFLSLLANFVLEMSLGRLKQSFFFTLGAWDPSSTVLFSNKCLCNGLMMAS